jgi:hypothetical protein
MTKSSYDTILLTAAVVCLLATASPATAASSKAATARAAFERLKGLAGEWRGTIGDREKGQAATVSYRLIANGSAVAETLLAGTPHEMITVFHLDGDKLVLTHYCAAGNQPKLSLTKKSTPDVLDFDFVSGTDMKSKQDEHMHSLRIRFEGANAIVTEWDGSKDGRKSDTTKFFLIRQP